MKHLLSVVFYFLLSQCFSQTVNFDFARAWEEVYQQEILGKPKSANELVDSIYNHAHELKAQEQQLKAAIYKAKFVLLLEEQGQQKVVAFLTNEIELHQAPYQQILQSVLAGVYSDYLRRNSYRLNSRSKSLSTSEDFLTWGEQKFISEIASLYQKSLILHDDHARLSVADFNEIITTDSLSTAYRPYLFDLLAYKALPFFKNPDYWSVTNDEALSSPVVFGTEETFENQTFYQEEGPTSMSTALDIYQRLYSLHKTTPDPQARIDLAIERLQFGAQRSYLSHTDSMHLAALSQLRDKYKTHPSSTRLDFQMARVYRNLADVSNPYNNYDHLGLVKAAQACSQALRRFPHSFGAVQCKALLADIESPTIDLTIEKFLTPEKPSKMLVSYKNLDQLHFFTYRMNIDTTSKVNLYMSYTERQGFLDSLAREQAWQTRLQGTPDYQKTTTEALFPPHRNGKYVLVVTRDEQGTELLAWDVVQVTNLGIIKKEETDEGIPFRLVQRSQGSPVANALISISTRSGDNKDTLNYQLTSDANGEFLWKPKKGGGRYRLFITKDENRLFIESDHYYFNNRDEPSEEDYETQLQLFTDRFMYRPGQKLYFKGILAKTQGKNATAFPGQQLTVYLKSNNHDLLDSLVLTTNQFGSVTGSFSLPKNGLTGFHYLEVDQWTTGDLEDDYVVIEAERHFRIEEYKRPTFEIVPAEIARTYMINDSVQITGKVGTYAGGAVSGASLKYTISRTLSSANLPFEKLRGLRGEAQILERGEVQTESTGRFEINFKAIADPSVDIETKPLYHFNIEMEVTDVTGETQQASQPLFVREGGYHIGIRTGKINLRQQNASIRVTAYDANQSPQTITGLFELIKLRPPSRPKRKAPWTSPEQPGFSREEHDKLFPNYPFTSEAEKSDWEELETYFSDSLSTGLDQSNFLGDISSWPGGSYLAKFTAVDLNGDTLKTERLVTAFDPFSDKIPDNELFFINQDKALYEVGDTAIIRYGTAAENLYIDLALVGQDGKNPPLAFEPNQRLSREVKTIRIPVLPSDQGGMAIHYRYVFENALHTGALDIDVARQNKSLDLEITSFRDKLLPGSQQQWSVTVKGQDAEPMAAELLASMYDASLDALSPHQWQFEPYHGPYFYGDFNQMGYQSTFATSRAQRIFYPNYFNPERLSYHQLNLFGFDFINATRANQEYINELIWRKSPRPYVFSSKKDLPEGTVAGHVLDERGLPLAGTNIHAFGTGKAVTADSLGAFQLESLGADKLSIYFIGYKTYTIDLNEDNYFEIVMAPDFEALEEVVVVGYGTLKEKKQLNASVAGLEIIEIADSEDIVFYNDMADGDALAGRTYSYAADMAPGAASYFGSPERLLNVAAEEPIEALIAAIDSMQPPMVILDGQEVAYKDIEDVEPFSIKYVQPTRAIALFGERASRGAIVIISLEEQAVQNETLSQVKTRQDLSEMAFFFPQLKTDSEGNISFSFQSPEALTRWKMQLLAHDKSMNYSLISRQVVTQKELMLLPNLPRFFREGDKLNLSAKIASLSADSLSGMVRLELFNALTEEPLDELLPSSRSVHAFQLIPKGNVEQRWELDIAKGIEAVRYKIVASAGNFSDGQEGIIPVLSSRQLVQESLPIWANPGEKRNFRLEKLLNDSSSTLTHHRLSVSLNNNPVWEALRSLPYLIEYPYECAEQTFARYFANSLAQHILESQPGVKQTLENWQGTLTESRLEQNPELRSLLIEETPWLRQAQNEREQRARLSELLLGSTTEVTLTQTLNRLGQMQLPSGAFPWFSGGRPNSYITTHIIQGLLHLQKITGNQQTNEIMEKGISYLENELIAHYQKTAKKSSEPKLGTLQVSYLYINALAKDREKSEDLLKVEVHYDSLARKHWPGLKLKDKAMLFNYALARDDFQWANNIANSLKEYSTQSDEKGTFWLENTSGSAGTDIPVETQAYLIEAFTQLGTESLLVDEMKKWLLTQKRTQAWQSTKATTLAIYSLLLGNQEYTKVNDRIKLKVGKEKVNTREGSNTGQYSRIWSETAIKKRHGQVSLKNRGETATWGALNWQYFEDLDKITSSEGPLTLERHLFKVEKMTNSEVIKDLSEANLKLGDLVRVRIVIHSDRDMQFLHLKDMRASGLEPVNALSGYHWQDGLAYYESTRDAATNFFIEYLPSGTFVFEYDLRVNNEGDFSTGITTIQNMYAPELSNHSMGKRVRIGQ